MMNKYTWTLLSLLTILVSCNNDTVAPAEKIQMAPYALTDIQQRTYIVDSIIFDLVGTQKTVDTTHYIWEERYISTDSTGRHYQMWQREVSDTSFHFLAHVSYASRAQDYTRKLGNQSLIITKYPVATHTSWDVSSLNSPNTVEMVAGERIFPFINWESSYTTIEEPLTLAGNTYPTTISIQAADYENAIEYRSVNYTLAQNVGLVQYEAWILDTQCGGNLANCVDLSWEQKAEKGYILNITLIDYQ